MAMRVKNKPAGNAEIKWFVEGEPGNGPTNELITREISAECAHKDVLCSDGRKHNLWECSSLNEIRVFVRHYRETANFLRFAIWMQYKNRKPQRLGLKKKDQHLCGLKRKTSRASMGENKTA
ncbi:MAG: hypothetical protein AAB355_00950 [Patescibacteria group bacterium]